MPCSQPIWVPVCPQSSRIASAQRAPRLDRDGVIAAVDGKGDAVFVTHAILHAALFLGAQRRADALRRRRHFVDLDAEQRERVVDGVDHRRRRADGAAFAEALGLGNRVRARRLHVVQLDRRHLARGRRHVVGEIGGEDAAGLVVDDFFEQRVADALGDAAMHLALGDHRIDDAAGVLRDQILLDRDLAGLDVHLDDGHVAGVGERAGRIVGAGLGQAGLDLAVEAVRLRVGLARHLGDRHRAVGAGDLGRAVFQHDVAGRRFQQVAGDLDQLGAHLARRDQRGAAGDHQRAAGEGAPAVGRGVGVAMHDLDRSGATPISSAMICASVVRKPCRAARSRCAPRQNPEGRR